jgi:EmrB/QacA subfamily drug resistance transporter
VTASPETAKTPAESDRLDPRIWKIAAVVAMGPLMSQMDSTVVNVSLSTIRHDLHTSIDTVQWIVGGYLLALALVLPLNAWLVDRVGAKRLYLASFSAFTLASLLCGAARSIETLICARLLQGVAGGLLAPMAQMMMARIAGRHMAKVMGYSVMPVLIAPIIGPTIAGGILKYAGWPWLFYINLPIGILAVMLAARLLPTDEAPARKRRFDVLGFLMISPALVALLYGFDHVRTLSGDLILLAGALLMAAFVRHALLRGDAALVDVRLFGNRIFTTATTTQFLSNSATAAGQLLLPLFLIVGCGFTPSAAGGILAAQGLGMLCIYPALGFITGKFLCRPVSSGGALLVCLSTLPILWMTVGPFTPWLMIVTLFLRGLGQGAVGLPAISAGYAAVPKDKLPLAATAANIAQRVGAPVGTTLMGIVLSQMAPRHDGPGAHAFTVAFLALTGLQLLVLGSASRLPMRIHADQARPVKA